MGNPVVYPPPARPPRSFAGPVVLIVIGLLFLLGNMHIVHWPDLARWFAHFWPVLLILWGVIKLIEHQQAARSGYRARGIGVGGAFLLIFLVVTGLAATQASRWDWNELRDHVHIDDDDLKFFGHTYDYNDELQQDFPAGGSLHVNNEHGVVNVTASNDDKVHVSVHKHVHADSQAEADKRGAKSNPRINAEGGVVTVNSSGGREVSTDLDISVPTKAGVNVTSRHGDINITQRDGDVSVTGQHGDVSVSDVRGKVTLTLDHNSARLSDISSDVVVNGRSENISADNIKGQITLTGEFSETVKLSNIARGVSFKSSRTDIDFPKLDGDLDLDSGDLRASNLTGPVRLNTRAKDIVLDDVAGDVRVNNENGTIEIRSSKIGAMEVQNRNGDLQVFLPEKSGFQLAAQARNGDIETDFDALKVSENNDTAVGTGTVGNGGPHLSLNNEHGDIEIRKGSGSVPQPPKPPAPPHMRSNSDGDDEVKPTDN